MRLATDADISRIEAHLTNHIETSVFPLANLRAHGLNSDALRGMTFWIDDLGVLGVSNEGMVMPQRPDATDWSDAVAPIRGRLIKGVIGDTKQARAILDALNLSGQPTNLDEDEPCYRLSLCDLKVPDGPGQLIKPDTGFFDVMVRWRSAYHQEVLGTSAKNSHKMAQTDVEGFLAKGSHRILSIDGQPAGMTGFNATLPDLVQIGGVYTPPEKRGRGIARRAVALHLKEAREDGVTSAILFAVSPAAQRAYEALGFRQIGSFTLTIFRNPVAAT